MKKYQKGQNNQQPEGSRNFKVGDLIKGSFSLVGLAQLAEFFPTQLGFHHLIAVE